MGEARFFLRYFEEILAGFFMVVMTLTTFLNVIMRYVFNSPFQWAEEFARYSFIWLVFMGAVIATKYKRHIVIDGFVMALPERVQALIRVLVDLMIFGLMAVMLYYGWVLSASATQPTSTLKVPQYVVYVAVPFSALLIAIHSVEDFRKDVRALRGGERA